ncbi:MAG: bifunctional hydroxymethylpyrimidine kinase/phosphomethylpyrimidine kinase [Candidatus Aminicenantes bacterium]|nr:bifunctional hydroxymethylpyrimidine kinase/phosphomethylpyrimidine kinase [Candidatus Aminicenantes bacterium]
MKKKKVLLSIAGYDPTSGAGVLLDIQTFVQMGFHGVGIVTALTAQNTEHIRGTFFSPSDFLEEQYHVLSDDIEISGIKVGMLGCRENIPVIVQILSKNPEIPLVVDPIMKSSSGYWLLEKTNISAYTEAIGPKVSLLTPNLHEAKLLSGIDIKTINDMKKAAESVFNTINTPCLVTGGHLKDFPTDVLYDGKKHTLFENEKIERSVHGTGCFLSSSILGYLVLGHSIRRACRLGVQDTTDAIKKAVPIGHGQHIIKFGL